MITKFRIFGESLAALVLVQKLAENKENCIEWFLGHKVNSTGGYFAGTRVFDQLLDIGMVALEVDEPVKKIEKFVSDKPVRGQDINPYLHKVRSWLQNQGVLISNLPVYTKYLNKLFPDLFITNDLELLKVLYKDKNMHEIYDESLYNSKLHPKNKNNNNFAPDISLGKYIDEVYGKIELSKIMKDFVGKIDENALNKVLVSKHRSLWIPLYYPETIKNVITRKELGNNIKRIFSCVSNNTLANSINTIMDSVKKSRNIKLVNMNSNLDKETLINNLDSSQNNIFIDDQKVLSEKNKNKNDHLKINIIFIKTFDEIPNLVVFDPDSTTDFYRLTSRNTLDNLGFNYICLETKKDFQNNLYDPIFIHTIEKYIFLNLNKKIIVEDIHQKSGRLSLFTSQSESSTEIESREVSELLDMNNVTNLSYTEMSSSMNEQILLGLWYVEVIERRKGIYVK